MPSREEAAILADHGERYRSRDAAIAREVEQAVFGTALGANGYTTLAQAERLAGKLALTPGARVLDIGCGCGWPGLYLAEHRGARLVGSDLPFEGLARAVGNAARGGLAESSHWVQASARALPFRHGAFDAVIHADVLC
ncbi:MAG: class I SAM-dependent methyltransferase [Thermoanaerobaculia bacterium]|nr:class I SAM-dependent methyltransferase [Thermoanaerobaculia bacterium]